MSRRAHSSSGSARPVSAPPSSSSTTQGRRPVAGDLLVSLGWTDELEAAFAEHAERGFEAARVVAEHRGGYFVRGERGDHLAHARGRLRDDEIFGGMPCVGDWVAI